MATGPLLTIFSVFILLTSVFASLARDFPVFNSTVPAITTSSTETETPKFKPHLEISIDDPNENTIATDLPHATEDVGSIIASLLPEVTEPRRTQHLEASTTTFSEAPVSANDSDHERPSAPGLRPHLEASADDFTFNFEPRMTAQPSSLPPVVIGGRPIDTVLVTIIVVNNSTVVPGRTATIVDGTQETLIHINPSGQPEIVVGATTSTFRGSVFIGGSPATVIPSGLLIDGQTLTAGGSPLTLGSTPTPTTVFIDESGTILVIVAGATSTVQAPTSQEFLVGDITATALANNYQYAIGSSVLQLGQPLTVDSTIFALNTDSRGATVIVVGDSSTTLAAVPSAVPISTTVLAGTTHYIIGSQTLAPGHPITVDGTPISISTSSDATILVVGDKTTTVFGNGFDDVRAATPGTYDGSARLLATGTPSSANNIKKSSGYFGAVFGAVGLAMMAAMV